MPQWKPPEADLKSSSGWQPPEARTQGRTPADVDRVMREKYPQAFEKPNAPQSWGDVAERVTVNDIYAGPVKGVVDMAKSAWNDPAGTVKDLFTSNFREAEKAADAYQKGNKGEAVARGVAAAIPVVGPGLTAIGDKADIEHPGELIGNAAMAASQATPTGRALTKESALAIKEPVVNVAKTATAATKAAVKAGGPDLAKGTAKIAGGAALDAAGAPYHLGTVMGLREGIGDIASGTVKGVRAGKQAMQPPPSAATPKSAPVATPVATPIVKQGPHPIQTSPSMTGPLRPAPNAPMQPPPSAMPQPNPVSTTAPASAPPSSTAPQSQFLPNVQGPQSSVLPTVQPQSNVVSISSGRTIAPPPAEAPVMPTPAAQPPPSVIWDPKRGHVDPTTGKAAGAAKPPAAAIPEETLFPAEGTTGMPATSMPREHYIQGAQTMKARALARMMKIEKIPLEDAMAMTPEQWEMVAKAAGVNKPSATTIQKAIEEMRNAQ
jgi:hypothetical protein